MKLLADLKIDVPRTEILKRLRYREGTTILPSPVEALLDRMIARGYALAAPAAVYRVCGLERQEAGGFLLEGTALRLEGKSVERLLVSSERVALMAATVGGSLPEEADRLMSEGKFAEATLLDAFGSEAAEELAERVNDVISREARLGGYGTTPRFSPGYGDFAVSAQRGILDLLDAGRIGLRLNEAFMMVPEKSVTAIIGWVKRG